MSCMLILLLIADPPMVVWTAQPGESFIDVENIGDINGDGTDDIAAATELNESSGLYCLNGLTGETLWSVPEMPGVTLTGALCALPDINGDGFSDLALGTGWESGSSTGFTNIISGLDGNLIWSRQAEWPVEAVSYSTGPAGTFPVIHSTLWANTVHTFFLALDSETGDSLWRHQTWTRDRQISVISDFSGNNWDEISICHDRGSVYSGFCEVVDGLTGGQLYSTNTIYFGAMDIVDTPLFTIATRSWGGEYGIQAEDMVSGDTLYIIEEEYINGVDTLKFVTGVTGGSLPFPILTGWCSSLQNLYLICGPDGSFQVPITYGSSVVLPVAYQESESLWNLAVLTEELFYITEPAIINSESGPSCDLPSPPGKDMCLLTSDLYPTQLAAVAMSSGTGSGLCAIATSWPAGTDVQINSPVTVNSLLLSNPGSGGIHFQIEKNQQNILVLDITGRIVEPVHQFETGVHFLPLPAGVYHVIDIDDLSSSLRAVVLSN